MNAKQLLLFRYITYFYDVGFNDLYFLIIMVRKKYKQ